jgi:amino acid permease
MRLTRKDGLATLFVAAAGILYALWLTGFALTGASTRVIGAIIFGLGWAACMSNQSEMAAVFGAGTRRRVPMTYVVIASLIGALALVAGVITLVSANEPMLATLVVATITLWAMSTIRHGIARDSMVKDHELREPLNRAA